MHRKGARARILGVGVRAPGRQLTTSRGNPLIGVPRPPLAHTPGALSLSLSLPRSPSLSPHPPVHCFHVSHRYLRAQAVNPRVHRDGGIQFVPWRGEGASGNCSSPPPAPRPPVSPRARDLLLLSVQIYEPFCLRLVDPPSNRVIKPGLRTSGFDHCPHAPRGNLPTRRLPQHHHPPSLARARAGSLTNTHVRCLSLSLS